MKIGGLQKTSLIEFPGKICAIIFTQGCNFRCPYCHNPELVEPEKFSNLISEEEIFSFLKKRKKYLNAVSITGGEPCLQKDIFEFMDKIKNMGFLIKLETNGSFPEVIKTSIKKSFVDYLSMDIKGPFEKYDKIVRVKIDISKIKESINLIMNSGLNYEFKTTVVKSLITKKDFESIGNSIKGAKLYFLQKFVSIKLLDPDFSKEETYSDEEFEEIKNLMKNYVSECEIR